MRRAEHSRGNEVLGDRYPRFVLVVEAEPELAAWQLAERFGITERQASLARCLILLRARRRAARHSHHGAAL